MPGRVDADRGSSSSITGLIGAEMVSSRCSRRTSSGYSSGALVSTTNGKTDHVRVLEDAPEPPQALATETPVRRGPTTSKNPSFVEEAEGPADWLLVLAKCTVPAFFVAASGAVAIPVNKALGDGEGAEFFRKASEEFAGGALIVTYAIELSQGYITKKDGALSRKLVAATLIGTIFSGQLQALGQALWPYEFIDSDGDPDNAEAGDAIPFALGFFVDGVVLAYEPTVRPPDKLCRCRSLWRRVRPAFTSVLTFVMSIDNAVDGFGMYQKLDRAAMPAWGYYACFVLSIYLGGALTILVQRVPSLALQSFWYAFGAFAILDGGLELASDGLSTFVLIGFIFVWLMLFAGQAAE